METIIISLSKKAKKYYHGYIEGSKNIYKAKLYIDENSESHHLPLNTPLRLIVNNHSLKSEYGTTLIYSISEYMHDLIEDGTEPICFKPTFYNELLTEQCKDIMGVFNDESSEWQFWPHYREQAEELINCWVSSRVALLIRFKESQTLIDSRLSYCGETICFAVIANSGEEVLVTGDNAELISGEISVITYKRKMHIVIKAETMVKIKIPKLILNHEQKKAARSNVAYQFSYW